MVPVAIMPVVTVTTISVRMIPVAHMLVAVMFMSVMFMLLPLPMVMVMMLGGFIAEPAVIAVAEGPAFQRLIDPVVKHIEQQRMRAQGAAHLDFYPRMLCGET